MRGLLAVHWWSHPHDGRLMTPLLAARAVSLGRGPVMCVGMSPLVSGRVLPGNSLGIIGMIGANRRRLLDQPFNGLHERPLFAVAERHGKARSACPTGAANAVHVG